MKIGHWQLECTPGDPAANIEKLIAGLKHADAEGLSIVSFPESFLTGFFLDAGTARRHSWSLDGPQLADLCRRTAGFNVTWMAGFNERRGDALYNTVVVVERGRILGRYSKVFPEEYFTPGREFPVFTRDGVRFGVIVCADGGYIEPARILALRGARIIFAPHYNYITPHGLLDHFVKVRSDHIARAVENNVWFLRGNNVVSGYDAGLGFDGVGYGESYLLDPSGEVVARSQRHTECFISTDVSDDARRRDDTRSRRSAEALGGMLLDMLEN